jgi:hypothetical protein
MSESTPPQAQAVADVGLVYKLAQIESVRASLSSTHPAQAEVVITGFLPDGATQVHEVQQQRLDDGFVLTVITSRPRSAMATLALIPFARTITLDLAGLPPGPCRIVAHGLAATVEKF